jgi:hypothetical protein
MTAQTLRRQITTVMLLFGGYGALYFCPADLSVATPMLNEELGRHGVSQADATVSRPAGAAALLNPRIGSRAFQMVCLLSLGCTIVRETFNICTPALAGVTI